MRYRKDSISWKEGQGSSGRHAHRPSFLARLPLRYLKIVGLVLIVLIGLVIFLRSSLFEVRHIEIQGLKNISEQSIRALAEAQMEKSRWFIFKQSSVFFFHTANFIATTEEQQPRIATIEIKRRFPPTLSLTVQEHTRAALWQSQNRYYETNEHGEAVAEAVAPTGKELMLVNSARLADVHIGEQVIEPEALRHIERMHAQLEQVSGISIASFDVAEYSLYTVKAKTKSGWHLYLSTHLAIEEQVTKLAVFVDEKRKQNRDWEKGITYVDLRFGPTKVYYR